jgi:hypothetical protein
MKAEPKIKKILGSWSIGQEEPFHRKTGGRLVILSLFEIEWKIYGRKSETSKVLSKHNYVNNTYLSKYTVHWLTNR